MHTTHELMPCRQDLPDPSRPSASRIRRLVLAGIAGIGLGICIGAGGYLSSSSPGASAAPAAQEAASGAMDARQAHAPMLGRAAANLDCAAKVEIRNQGAGPTVVAFIGWREIPSCFSSPTGPGHVACSGLIAPGATWTIAASEIPSDLQNGSFYSLSAADFSAAPGLEPRPVASILCDALAASLIGDNEAYRRFKRAFDLGGPDAPEFAGIPAARISGEPIEVIVRRDCEMGEGRRVATDYVAVAGDELTILEFPGATGNMATMTTGLLPFLVADSKQLGSSFIHIQNTGTECALIELWFATDDECLRRRICPLTGVAAGSTQTVDVRDCIGEGARGVGWLRSGQPLAILVDTAGASTVPSFTHESRGARGLMAGGIMRAVENRTTLLHLSNHDRDVAAFAELSFRRGEEIDATLGVWICPKGGTTVDPRRIPALHDGWRGEVRIISLRRDELRHRPSWSPISGIVSLVEHPGPSQPIALSFAWMEPLDGSRIESLTRIHELFLPFVQTR